MKLVVKMNPTELLTKVKAAKKDWLYRAGAYLRRAARSSVKRGRYQGVWFVNSFGVRQFAKRGIPSAPGEPPRDFNGWRKTFHFDVDNVAETVAVGAVAGRKGIPPLHEYGGSGTVTWTEKDRRGRWHKRTTTRHYPPRPVMQPAYEKSKVVISKFWSNAIR